MKRYWHEVPSSQFTDTFAGVAGLDRNAWDIPADSEKLKDLSKLPVTGPETSMYLPLCTTFNEVLALAAPQPSQPRYVFKDVSTHPKTNVDDLKIDLAMYPMTARAQEAFQQRMPPTCASHVARNAWAWMTTGVEVKSDPDRAAFYFEKGGPLLRDTVGGKESQAQFAKYATELMVRQHRTFVFLIYILNDKARITRWDRAGCIVSTPIDLVNEPEQLLNFIHRLALMSDEELGFDTTAVLASQEEIDELKGITHKNPYAKKRADDILSNQIFDPIYKVECPDVKGGGKSTYFIGKHTVASYSPTGRATRGFVAFRKGHKRLCFLKDYWRPNSSEIRAELAVYERLSMYGVRHVAVALGGGDVAHQITITDQYLKHRLLLQRLHYRIVIEQLARPLEDYRNSTELILLVYDALQGHEEAWTKAGILHRDISDNNIMRVVNQDEEKDDVNGILIDWDLCKNKSDLSQNATQHGRSGTWPFMSALSLRYPFKPNDLADDLESFVHVITYCSLRFHWHDKTSRDLKMNLPSERLFDINSRNISLTNHVCKLYDESEPHAGDVYSGGSSKFQTNKNGSPDFVLDQTVSPELIMLVSELYELLAAQYADLDIDYLAQYGAPKAQSPPEDNPGDVTTWQQLLARREPPPPTQPAGKGSVPKPPKRRPFDTHQKIQAVFVNAYSSIFANVQQGIAPKSDKTPDQFHGLCRSTPRAMKSASGSRRYHEMLGSTIANQASGSGGNKSKRQRTSGPSLGQGQLDAVAEQPA